MANICDFNKNLLLEFFFGELHEERKKQVHSHLEGCPECRQYLLELGVLDDSLKLLSVEKPAPWTLEKVMERIPEREQELRERPEKTFQVPALPFLKIILCIAFMIGALLLINWKVTTQAFWGQIRDWWFMRAFGSLGFTAAALFLIGAAITLVLLPVFILDSKSNQTEFHCVK